MKASFLDYAACPKCGQPLLLIEPHQRGDEVVSGRLKCKGCAGEFKIEEGIPFFEPSFDEMTIKNFGFSWRKFSGIYENQKEDFLDSIWPVNRAFFKGKIVLDAGAGTGHQALFASEFGAKEVCALDLSSAVRVAYGHCRNRHNISVIQANIYAPPLVENTFDYIYSLGVLQHLSEKKTAVIKLSALLKKGGSLSLLVYSNELGPLVKAFISLLRGITSGLGLDLVYGLTFPLAVLFFLTGRLYRLLAGLSFARRVLPMREYFLYMARFPFHYQRNTVFDQLAAPRTHYFSIEELKNLFWGRGYDKIIVSNRNAMSWRIFAQNKR